MDSFRPSLSQALPLGYDPEKELSAPFRAAALGIATFYKKANTISKKAYQLGYCAGLQDVLEYLQAGLDHGSDSTRRQGSEERMAMTIERVMDYIERRQEVLRGDASDSGDDETQGPGFSAPQPRHQPAPHPTHHSPTVTITATPLTTTAVTPSHPVRTAGPSRSQVRRNSPRRTVEPVSSSTATASTPTSPATPQIEILPPTTPSIPSSNVTATTPISVPTSTPAFGTEFEVFPFNFNPFPAPTPTSHPHPHPHHGHGHPRRGQGRELRKGKGRDKEHREREREYRDRPTSTEGPPTSRAEPVEVIPASASGAQRSGYSHYGTPVSGEGGVESVGGASKRRYGVDNSEAEPTITPVDVDEVMADLERPSKRISRR